MAMENTKQKQESETEKDFFEQYGLAVARGPIMVGNTYPIFGMITKVSEAEGAEVIVEINRNITARMNITEPGKLDILRKKAFETGIFVAKVLQAEPTIEVECQAVIFGRDQAYSA